MTPAAKSVVDWDGIDTVLVDMDGTLLDLNFDNLFWREIVPQRYARLRGMTRGGRASSRSRRASRPRSARSSGIASIIGRATSASISRRLKREHREHIRFLPGAQDFLASVRARGKRVCRRHERASRHVRGEGRAHRHRSARRRRRVLARLRGAEGKRGVLARARASTSRSTRSARCCSRTASPCSRPRAPTACGTRSPIRRPDSQLPPRAIAEFVGVDGVFELV